MSKIGGIRLRIPELPGYLTWYLFRDYHAFLAGTVRSQRNAQRQRIRGAGSPACSVKDLSSCCVKARRTDSGAS